MRWLWNTRLSMRLKRNYLRLFQSISLWTVYSQSYLSTKEKFSGSHQQKKLGGGNSRADPMDRSSAGQFSVPSSISSPSWNILVSDDIRQRNLHDLTAWYLLPMLVDCSCWTGQWSCSQIWGLYDTVIQVNDHLIRPIVLISETYT